MIGKTFAVVLSVLLVFVSSGFRPVSAQTNKGNGFVEQARVKVQQIGVGSKARVEVKLRDKTKVKGYVSATGEDSFTVTDAKTGASQTVAYTEVAQVKKPGGGLSALTWGIIGAAAVAAVIVGVTVIRPVLCDGGAGC